MRDFQIQDQRALDRVGRYARRAESGLGELAREAIEHALGPFDGIVNELLASVPNGRIE